MSTITEEEIEFASIRPASRNIRTVPPFNDDSPEDSAYSTTAIPDGGYGWTIVICCSITAFFLNGTINCWGVLQAALLDSTLSKVPASTLSFVGSVGLSLSAGFGIVAVRIIRWLGTRTTSLLGLSIMGLSMIGSSFCTLNVGGLFVTSGIFAGIGMAMAFTVTNILPVQFFSSKLGLANGLVKLGGGIGGTVMAVALEALHRRVGIAWTFRIQGLLTIGIGLPAAWMLKERAPLRNVPFVDLDMFKSVPFVAVFLAGAIGSFAFFVPPYYLPLFAQSIGLSSSTGASLVAGFNASNAIGRFVAGPLCDRVGPVNMFLFTMILNAVSMLAIWPVSNTLGPLVLFAALSGIANGSFFTTLPTVGAGMFGPGRAAVAMSMSTAGWFFGYLLGSPIAGYLLQAAGGSQDNLKKQGVEVYRPAIFYAGGVATVSSLVVLVARLKITRKMVKRV